MMAYPLVNFETQKYHEIELKSSVYSRNNLPNLMDGVYIITVDEFKSIGTYWIALYVNGNNGSPSYNVIQSNLKKLKNS